MNKGPIKVDGAAMYILSTIELSCDFFVAGMILFKVDIDRIVSKKSLCPVTSQSLPSLSYDGWRRQEMRLFI